MPELATIPVTDLLFDLDNPRLSGGYSTQQEAALELAQQQGPRLIKLASDIVENGTDPLSLTAVVPSPDRRKRYTVIEGNRRLLALRALETPSLVNLALTDRDSKRLTELSRKYAQDPIDTLNCVVFKSADEPEAVHWVELRHIGEDGGAGLVQWGSDEKDRFNARHKGKRRPAGQVLDFVEKHGVLSAQAQSDRRGILTTLQRLLTTPEARQALGVDVDRGQVIALVSRDALVRSLSHVVEQLKTGEIGVPDVYRVEDRKRYVSGLPRKVLPKKSERLKEPVVLDDITAGTRAPRTATQKQPKRKPGSRTTTRTTVVPQQSSLNVTTPRINLIYAELSAINCEQFPNASSVLLRVFVQLSVDHYIETHKLMSDKALRSAPLAKCLNTVADHLHSQGDIPAKLRKAVERIATGTSVLAPSVPTFHLYVHNQYVFPRPAELYAAWDELEPFLAKIWP